MSDIFGFNLFIENHLSQKKNSSDFIFVPMLQLIQDDFSRVLRSLETWWELGQGHQQGTLYPAVYHKHLTLSCVEVRGF